MFPRFLVYQETGVPNINLAFHPEIVFIFSTPESWHTSNSKSVAILFSKCIYYLAALGLRCDTEDLQSSFQHAMSSVAT